MPVMLAHRKAIMKIACELVGALLRRCTDQAFCATAACCPAQRLDQLCRLEPLQYLARAECGDRDVYFLSFGFLNLKLRKPGEHGGQAEQFRCAFTSHRSAGNAVEAPGTEMQTSIYDFTVSKLSGPRQMSGRDIHTNQLIDPLFLRAGPAFTSCQLNLRHRLLRTTPASRYQDAPAMRRTTKS